MIKDGSVKWLPQPLVQSMYHVLTRRPTNRNLKEKSVGTTPTDFSNGRGKVVGLPTGNGWEPVSVRVFAAVGEERRKGRGYLKIFPFTSAFFCIAPSANPRERVVRLFHESPTVGLLGLRIVISSRQPMDCWGFAFPGYRQWACRNSARFIQRTEGRLPEQERKGETMSESPEDEMEILPQVPVKPILPSISTDDKEFQELKEDLRAMGCGKLLVLP